MPGGTLKTQTESYHRHRLCFILIFNKKSHIYTTCKWRVLRNMASKGVYGNDISLQIKDAIVNNEPAILSQILLKADINACLNNRRDSPLFLAVKLSHGTIVRTLLASPGCDLDHQNINGYSPLDLSLVMVYDNQDEKRQNEYWSILEMLLEAGAEPACQGAMLYVIRTALKLKDDEFILRLIKTVNSCSNSIKLHSLLIPKLHRNQPLYEGQLFNDFLEQASSFTIKLIKAHGSTESLKQIFECFTFYVDSHWYSRQRRDSLYTKLVVYLTAAGWKWSDHGYLDQMARISPGLSQWCETIVKKPLLLTRACRITLNSCAYGRQICKSSKIPTVIISFLNYSDIDSLFPFTSDFQLDLIKL
ncbi:hypothetical protein Btru_068463 [Bulinus truncatus]|nr:hypothetical protein Btru_068463 [Bulinus truncatus]